MKRILTVVLILGLPLAAVVSADEADDLFREIESKFRRDDPASFDAAHALWAERRPVLQPSARALSHMGALFGSYGRWPSMLKDKERLVRCADAAEWCVDEAAKITDPETSQHLLDLVIAELQSTLLWAYACPLPGAPEGCKNGMKRLTEHLRLLIDWPLLEDCEPGLRNRVPKLLYHLVSQCLRGEMIEHAKAAMPHARRQLDMHLAGNDPEAMSGAEASAFGTSIFGAAKWAVKREQPEMADALFRDAVRVFTTLTGGKDASVANLEILADLYDTLADREPPKAVEHIEKALVLRVRILKESEKTAVLFVRLGDSSVRLAEALARRIEKTPRDSKLRKAADNAWKDALDYFEEARTLDPKYKEINTLYNRCLWQVMRITKGRDKRRPAMLPQKTTDGSVQFEIPRSHPWNIKRTKDWVYDAAKIDKRSAQALTMLISKYRWDTDYRIAETGEVIGGDNLGGLARYDAADVKAYFQDIKEWRPLKKMRLSRGIPKAQGFSVKGMTKDGSIWEWRGILFKHPKAKATYVITIIASLGMIEDNPYELKAVLDSFEMVE